MQFEYLNAVVNLDDANNRDALEGDLSRPLLRIVSLSGGRVLNGSSGCLSWPGMHDAFRRVLEPHFMVHMSTASELHDSFLDDAHMLLLNMCGSSTALSNNELECLQRWIREKGGVAILNSFSNWSENEKFNSDIVEWLGIDNPPTNEFAERTLYQVDVESLVRNHPQLAEPLQGPHGLVNKFENLGSTPFTFAPADESESHVEPAWICKELAYFGGLFGQRVASVDCGVVLVTSNFHWLCSKVAWEGGLLEEIDSNNNAVLLRNLAARAARAIPWSKQRHAGVSNGVRATVQTILLIEQRIRKSKNTTRPHKLPTLPIDIWLNILEHSAICELEPKRSVRETQQPRGLLSYIMKIMRTS